MMFIFEPMTYLRLLILGLVLYSCAAHAQCVAPYSNLSNNFYAYENGEGHFLEPIQPTSFKVGKNFLAFINGQNSRLRVYYGDKVYTVCENAADYWATDNWFVWKNFGLLGVLYNNELKTLDKQVNGEYWIGDSLIAWNSQFNDLRVFYQGETRAIDQFLPQQKTAPDGTTTYSNVSIGPNILAYVDQSVIFKAFYNNKVVNVENYEPPMFKCARDFIVYIDYNNNYKFFYKGVSYETTINNIKRYWLGEGFFAYYNIQSELAVWYDGEENIIAQDLPQDITVANNIIAYTDKSNNFWVWYKGKVELLERFKPQSVKVYRDLLVYQDQYGRLKGYYFGKQVDVSDQIVTSYNMYNATVSYSLQRGETIFWCEGKSTPIEY